MTENKQHPYADILRAIADGKIVQWQDDENSWNDQHPDLVLRYIHDECDVKNLRIKPRTININGFDVPEPLRVAPLNGARYFIVVLTGSNMHSLAATWSSADSDLTLLSCGLIHMTREAAKAHAKALLSFTDGSGTKE